MTFDPRSLIDPAFFSRLESIELRARSIVEGSMHGLHRNLSRPGASSSPRIASTPRATTYGT